MTAHDDAVIDRSYSPLTAAASPTSTPGESAPRASRADGLRVHRATADAAAVLARHRAEMFRDMGQLDDANYAALFRASADYFRKAMASGEYLAWVATPFSAPDAPIAGAGLQLRNLLPRPGDATGPVVVGPEGIVVNVFTERQWRRRGVAALLMQEVMAWVRAHGIRRLVLHASRDGRALYENMGFVPTTEMRFAGPTDFARR